ncbi:MAG: F0F1 ATP synthase subunit B [Anaerolineae bacterium]|nr:F0F1 ATP synthase subunit B [Anaerolineae bacterium]
MSKNKSLKRILMVALLMASMLFSVSIMRAQEATAEPTAAEAAAEGDHSTEAAAEGETAAEAAPATSPLTPLGINAGFLIAQIVNFLIIFAALLFGLWRPIANMLDSRGAKIQKGLEDAQVAANARRNAEAEAETIRSNARADISKGVEEGRLRGDEVAKQIEAEARTEAEKIRAEARTAAAAERDQQLAGLRGQIAAISLAATHKLIGSALDDKKAKSLIDNFFTDVPQGALKLGGAVEVVSAMPLSADEQAKAKSAIGADSITFTVDPSILGGLIVRSGDRVVDGSVRSGLNDLSARLN